MCAARAGGSGVRGGNNSGNHNDLIASVRAYLTMRGAWQIKVLGGLGQRAGVPDILAAMRHPVHGFGVLVAVECKTGVAVLSPAQQRERAALGDVGAVYVLARCLEDVEDTLVAAGLCTPALLPFRRDA